MDHTEAFTSLSDTMQSSASGALVYGTPIERMDRTVVPITRVEFGLGAGGGGGGGGSDGVGGGGGTSGDDDDTEGGGIGGGFSAQPAGALEITDWGTRFVLPIDTRRSITVGLGGFVCGVLVCALLRVLGLGR